MASSNPVFRAACENDLWTRKKTTSAARQMVHRMNNGNLIKTALRVENMPRQRSLKRRPEIRLQDGIRVKAKAHRPLIRLSSGFGSKQGLAKAPAHGVHGRNDLF